MLARGSTARRAGVLAAVGLLTAAGSASASRTYHVQPGDSLTGIAVAHGTSVATLARLNGLSPRGVLLAGSTLKLPGPPLVRYRVRPGDTLTALAARYGTSPVQLAHQNGMHLDDMLLTGAVLRVPAGDGAARVRPVAHKVYVVRAGDSLSSIAEGHGVSLGALADLNRLALGDVLVVGKRLVLPDDAIEPSLPSYPRSTVRGSLLYWSAHYDVDPHLATALAWMESGFNNSMVSTAGAVGVMQVTPATWDYVEQVLLLGETVPHDADGNVRIGVAYLHHLLNVFGGDEARALGAYYQGARAVQDAGFLPGTQQYVDDILALKQRF
jgi:LysM repeat protein